MYKPDPVIVRKIKEYDPYLFVEWNNRRQFFEIWRMMPHGRKLITPVTHSIYEVNGKIEFCPLDERILWWLYEADGYNKPSVKRWLLDMDERHKDFRRKQKAAWKQRAREFGYDSYRDLTNWYTTKHASKNDPRPKFNKTKAYESKQWIAPDVQARSSSRLFSRSKGNAIRFGYRG